MSYNLSDPTEQNWTIIIIIIVIGIKYLFICVDITILANKHHCSELTVIYRTIVRLIDWIRVNITFRDFVLAVFWNLSVILYP